MLPDEEYINMFVMSSEIKVYKNGEQDLYTSFPVPEVVKMHLFQDEIYTQTIWPKDYASVESRLEMFNHLKEIVKRYEDGITIADEAMEDVFHYFKQSLGK